MIRLPRPGDEVEICRIYNHYVATTIVTFDTEPASEAMMAAAMTANPARLPWLVCEQEGRVVGYAGASEWKSRCAYRFSVESTIYLDPGCGGRGIGTRLYGDLLGRLRAAGHHSVLGGIALPNPASVALHEKLGFEKVGQLKEVGRKFDRWIDVGYWELIFD